MGSYLRTNYRITGRELDIDAIGGGVFQGSWGYAGSGPGTRREYGGFVMGSADYLSVNPTIGTFSMLSMYYGSGWFGEGYRVFPFAAFQVGTGTHLYVQWSISATAADSNIYFKTYVLTGDASTFETAAVVFTGASGSDVNLVWAGFIVSAP